MDLVGGTERLLLFFFSLQFSFFLGSMLGYFLLFPLAFVFTSFVAHICSSLLDSDLLRTVRRKLFFEY